MQKARNNLNIKVKEEIKKRGYKVVIVPHHVVGDHLGTYNVIYNGRHFMAPSRMVQKRLGEHIDMPLNQIWISTKLKKRVDIVLFHELQELKYRRRGYSARKAHKLAREDEKKFKKAMYS